MRLPEEFMRKYRVQDGYKQFQSGMIANAPTVPLTYQGYTPFTRSTTTSAMHSGGSNGLNIVAAILVTASSMMVLLALRLWLCRCSTFSSSAPSPSDSSSEPVKNSKNGIAREVINKFALVDFKTLSSKYDKTCTVCLSEFNVKDVQIRLLPGCNHSFHPACIEMWLFSHNSCPICRKSLMPVQSLPPVPSTTQDEPGTLPA